MNNHHKNARTTFHSRELMVERVLKKGMSVREVSEQLGVSRQTVYKWIRRYKDGGWPALYNKGCRPKRMPRRLRVELVATIAAMRRMRMTSPAIAYKLCIPVSTVSLELRRLGLNKLSSLEVKPPVMRYEHESPGDMLHLDIKKLGRIDGVGKRIHGDRSRRARGAGWEYLHVCVDDNSRVAYSELLPDEKAVTATCFLIRAAGWFRRHGVHVKRVLTDNGSCYNSYLFRRTCGYLGASVKKTRPYTPRTNGKAERFIQTSIKEWAYSQAYESSAEREEHLKPWLNFYNNERPHSALKRKPPVSRFEKCEQCV
jgi:transposase InsO family protein